MSARPLSDDADIGELDALVSEMLLSVPSDGGSGGKLRQTADARREVEQYLEEKRLREQMQDPYY